MLILKLMSVTYFKKQEHVCHCALVFVTVRSVSNWCTVKQFMEWSPCTESQWISNETINMWQKSRFSALRGLKKYCIKISWTYFLYVWCIYLNLSDSLIPCYTKFWQVLKNVYALTLSISSMMRPIWYAFRYTVQIPIHLRYTCSTYQCDTMQFTTCPIQWVWLFIN